MLYKRKGWLIVLSACAYMLGCSKPDFSHYIGQTDKQVIAAEGAPASTSDGPFGRLTAAEAGRFGQCKTSLWHRGEYRVYCTYELQGNTWILVETGTYHKDVDY